MSSITMFEEILKKKNKILDDLNQTFPKSVDLNVASQEIDAPNKKIALL